MLYGEVHPYGYFRFVNFGHPPPLVFSAEYRKFVELDKDRMVQFLPLGLQIPLIIRIVSGTSQSVSAQAGQLVRSCRNYLNESGRHSLSLYRWRLRRQRR